MIFVLYHNNLVFLSYIDDIGNNITVIHAICIIDRHNVPNAVIQAIREATSKTQIFMKISFAAYVLIPNNRNKINGVIPIIPS